MRRFVILLVVGMGVLVGGPSATARSPHDYVSVSPPELDFGTVQNNTCTVANPETCVVRTATITNTSKHPLTLGGFGAGQESGADLRPGILGTTCDLGSELQPGASCTVDVAVSPVETGYGTGSLFIFIVISGFTHRMSVPLTATVVD